LKAQRLYLLIVPFLVILAFGISVATDKLFYLSECKKLNTDCKASLLFVDYLKGNNSLSTLNLTPQETSHMQDVKNLFENIEFLFVFFATFTLSVMFFFLIKDRKKYREFIVDYLFFGGLLTLAIIILVLIFSYLGFYFVFEAFHKIFFANGNYTFSDQSTLIKLFPGQFFYDALTRIIIFSGIFSVFFAVTGYLLKKRKYDKI